MPGERFAMRPALGRGGFQGRGAVDALPFGATEIADRGPIERGPLPVPEPRARELRELERQRSWAQQATRAMNDYRADEVDDEEGDEGPSAGRQSAVLPARRTDAADADNAADVEREDIEDELDDDEALADVVRMRAASGDGGEGPALRMREMPSILPTLRVLPHGISRKRLEQAIKELQLPVIIARDPDEADVVMTLKNEYRQKTTGLREAENRGLPIYVLKSNTIVQMEASLTSIFSLEVDPREAALRETEEAIGLVIRAAEPVELSPQNAYIRRLQHQMAERANLVSRSRGREPYRRVRLYP
jgi:hypothetical protein